MKILDCSTLLPGPFIGKLLADEGADVIKIENPHHPDPARTMGSHYDELNEKKSLVKIDLKSSEGKTEFSSLIKKADGLGHNS